MQYYENITNLKVLHGSVHIYVYIILKIVINYILNKYINRIYCIQSCMYCGLYIRLSCIAERESEDKSSFHCKATAPA